VPRFSSLSQLLTMLLKKVTGLSETEDFKLNEEQLEAFNRLKWYWYGHLGWLYLSSGRI
jgi:hypothetical protein